ncbi:hypothetical protein PR048_012242 [Dryococelus australis]|uniref:Uncharacterized protein n=1 Tax=Dryococelus australis TaxID=614101 RepID=A0ABQ9HNT6_9NEOP|nr:hypothetical protein PR048_012242 [Dryococelus australis]
MTRALKKDRGTNREDAPGVNKTSESKIDEVKRVPSFPSYASHYTRKNNPHRRYLDSSLTVRKINIFKEENLYFNVPQKDTCQLCDKLKKVNVPQECEENSLRIKHELHLRKAEAARQSMKDDAVLAQTSKSKE